MCPLFVKRRGKTKAGTLLYAVSTTNLEGPKTPPMNLKNVDQYMFKNVILHSQ